MLCADMRTAWIQAMKREGVLSAYRGFNVAVASMAAYKALYFGLYDTAKQFVFGESRPGKEKAPIWQRAALAATTTFIAASVTYPLDIIRKRLIVDVGADTKQYGNSLRCAVLRIWRSEGIRGFYRFYWYDMFFRLGGSVLLVGYDLLKTHSDGSQHADDDDTNLHGRSNLLDSAA